MAVRLDHDAAARVAALRLDLPATPEEEAAYMRALAAVADLPAPYGLVVEVRGEGRFTEAGRREQALWFKANRARLEARCRAMAVVRPDQPDGGAKNAEGFGRMFAFPVAAAPDEAAARAFLRGHLPA